LDILQHLENEVILITPNRRLAATLYQSVNALKSQKMKKVWVNPTITPFHQWCHQLYEQQGFTEQCLSSEQENILWQKALLGCLATIELLPSDYTAQSLKAAWKLLHQWEIDRKDPQLRTTPSSEVLLMAGELFLQECERLHAIDATRMLSVLTKAIQKNKIGLPKKIIFYHFLEFTPQQNTLISVLKEKNCEVTRYTPLSVNKSQKCISLKNPQEEILTMARWAKKLIDTESPRIACIVPQINQRQEEVRSVFEKVFHESKTLPYNITAGNPLTEFPIIEFAFTQLNKKKQFNARLNSEEITTLLQSPFWGGAETEIIERSQLDCQFREDNKASVTLLSLSKNAGTTCPLATENLSAFIQEAIEKKPQHPSKWTDVFHTLLQKLGWPGERIIDSAEYQAVARFYQAMNEFASLDFVLGEIPYATAINAFKRFCYTIEFQIQSPETPLQILGSLEAAGLPFDYIWMSGLHDGNLPSSPSPNPFLPYTLQRETNMPHCSAERERNFSKKVLEQLQASCHYFIASFPEIEKDEATRISPLVASLKTIELENLDLSEYVSIQKYLQKNRELEPYPDEVAPPIHEKEKSLGGSGALKSQAHCPFQAFARYRLHSHSIPDTTLGYNPLEHGILVHRALELFWKHVKSSNQIQQLSLEDRASLIDTIIQKVIPPSHHNRFSVLHKESLNTLLNDYIDTEINREPFTVFSCEENLNTQLGDLSLSLKIDRVDQLESGEFILIDYKTGNTTPSHWFGHRLREPQLPLYAISYHQAISGICFTQIKKRDIQIKGIAAEDAKHSFLPSLVKQTSKEAKNDWASQLIDWRRSITALAKDFQQGVASVSPQNQQTCNTCDLQTLCRIHKKTSIEETTK
jgi:ATP-dependent helicase/nuclease subunit B